MTISRRAFFKGLCGGIGVLGVSNIILSQRGWLGFLAPAKAYAQPPVYYTLNDNFTFFEGRRTPGNPDPDNPWWRRPHPPIIDNEIRGYPISPRIIEWGPTNPAGIRRVVRIYNLNSSAAFITSMLLMGVHTDLLSKLYVSRFQVVPRPGQTPEQTAAQKIQEFIRSSNFFRVQTMASQSDENPASTPIAGSQGGRIWADFSMGSVYPISALKLP